MLYLMLRRPPEAVADFETCWAVLTALSFVNLPPEKRDLLRPLTTWLSERGMAVSGPEFGLAIGELRRVAARTLEALSSYDAVLTPTLAEPPLPRIRIRTVRQEQFDDGGAAGAGGGHQNRLAFGRGRLRIRTGLEQPLDDGSVAVLRRERDRGHAVAADDFRVRAGAKQQIGRFQIVRLHRPVERGRAIGERDVDGRRFLDQRPHDGLVSSLDGVDQRVVPGSSQTIVQACSRKRILSQSILRFAHVGRHCSGSPAQGSDI